MSKSTLNRLQPAALKAAMECGSVEWGRWGSAIHHRLYVHQIGPDYPMRRRRMCRCGCRKKVSHTVCANGVALASGCELRARRTMREWTR